MIGLCILGRRIAAVQDQVRSPHNFLAMVLMTADGYDSYQYDEVPMAAYQEDIVRRQWCIIAIVEPLMSRPHDHSFKQYHEHWTGCVCRDRDEPVSPTFSNNKCWYMNHFPLLEEQNGAGRHVGLLANFQRDGARYWAHPIFSYE